MVLNLGLGFLGESREEKAWALEINGKGWTDHKDKPDDLVNWAKDKGLDIAQADGQTFAWNRSWFNPLQYVTRPDESDPRRRVLSVLLGFSHERPSLDLMRLMAEQLRIQPLVVREQIIDYWKQAEIITNVSQNTLRAGPKLLAILGNIEEIIKGSSTAISVQTVREIFGDPAAQIPENSRRIIRHDVIIDLDALGLNEDWLYELVRIEGPIIDLLKLSKVNPLRLDEVEGPNLSEKQETDILQALCERLSTTFPDADITVDQTMMSIGNSKEVADAFIRKLESIKQQVSDRIDEKRGSLQQHNDMRRTEETIRRRERIAGRANDNDERKLALKGAILRKLESLLLERDI